MSLVVAIIAVLIVLVAGFVWLRSKKPPSTVLSGVPVAGIDFAPHLAAAQAAAAVYRAQVAAATPQAQTLAQMDAISAPSGVKAPPAADDSVLRAAQAGLGSNWSLLLNEAGQFSTMLGGWDKRTDLSTIIGASLPATALRANAMKYLGQVQGHVSAIANYAAAWTSAFQSAGRSMPAATSAQIADAQRAAAALKAAVTGSIPSALQNVAASAQALADAATSL